MIERRARSRYLVSILGLLLVGAGLFAFVYGLKQSLSGSHQPAPTALATKVEERLVPTPTTQEGALASFSPQPSWTEVTAGVTPEASTPPIPPSRPIPTQALTRPTGTSSPTRPPTGTPTSAPSATSEVIQTPEPTPSGVQPVGLLSRRQRVGVVAPMLDITRYETSQLAAGWFLPCQGEADQERLGGMECVRSVWVSGSSYGPDAEVVQSEARRDPGRLWLVGNEPDVIWQGNATPQEYAEVYHNVYQALKSADPTCHVAIGGISQVTPLRLRYLEAVLAAYQETYGQPMPVDVWNIHLAILREERGSWGVDIPPGLPDDTGILYEIQDNANVEILKEQVVTFRRWMAERGLRDKPLIVTEFSVLMPPEYGFPPERVQSFMLAAFDFFVSATDDRSGYPADGNRLVQRWAWYSVADRVYSTGNLFDPETGQITPLGRTFAQYTTDQ